MKNAMLRVAFKRRYLITIPPIAAFLFVLQAELAPKPNIFGQHRYWSYDVEKEEPLEAGQFCKLPRIHPFDTSILSYLQPPKGIRCKNRQPSLTYLDQEETLRFNETSLKDIGYNASDLQCYYQEIVRESDFKVSYGEKLRLPANGTRVQFEFVYVSCSKFGGLAFYTNIHCQIVPRARTDGEPVANRSGCFNVLVVGIDSLSRLSFMRYMPETYEYLAEGLGAFVLRGMTKIGDNTFPNLAAILTGKSVQHGELPNVDDPGAKHDDWPCLWKDFSRAHYATLFAEDLPSIGMFTYLRGGFRSAPTDHYMTPFWLAVQGSRLQQLSSSLCFGTTPKHLLTLNYSRAFAEKHSRRNVPFFAFSFFVELSHDYARLVSSADADFKSWLGDLQRSGLLDNTFLIFLSDHGHRFDSMRATLVGRIEERMPFFSIVVPPSVRESHPRVVRALKVNQQRLTTPFDTHETILDILRLCTGTGQTYKTESRGSSMLAPIPENRTCESASIPDHYCVCETEEQLPITDHRSLKASLALLDSINNMLASHGNHCSELSVSEIVRSDLIVVPRKVVVNSRIYFGKLKEDSPAKGMFGKLRIIIRTKPGDALFEGTLKFREEEDYYRVVDDISRINQYGTQSACIEHAILRKYCYCRNLTMNLNL